MYWAFYYSRYFAFTFSLDQCTIILMCTLVRPTKFAINNLS